MSTDFFSIQMIQRRIQCSPYLVGETYINTEDRDCVMALKTVKMKGFKGVFTEVTFEPGYSHL